MGHIELAAPMSHIWYFKGIPSRMGLLLDMSPRSLEKILYFASYVVVDPGETGLNEKQLLTEKEYRTAVEKYGYNTFEVGMGAEAVKRLLQNIDLEQQSKELRADLKDSTGQKRVRTIRRLEVVEAFKKSGNKPENWSQSSQTLLYHLSVCDIRNRVLSFQQPSQHLHQELTNGSIRWWKIRYI